MPDNPNLDYQIVKFLWENKLKIVIRTNMEEGMEILVVPIEENEEYKSGLDE